MHHKGINYKRSFANTFGRCTHYGLRHTHIADSLLQRANKERGNATLIAQKCMKCHQGEFTGRKERHRVIGSQRTREETIPLRAELFPHTAIEETSF